MTSPLSPYTGGSAPYSFPDTPIYDRLVAERGAPQIAPIRVPAEYEPVGPQLAPPPTVLPPALPALPALPSGASDRSGHPHPGSGLRPAHTAYPAPAPVPAPAPLRPSFPSAPAPQPVPPGQAFPAPAPAVAYQPAPAPAPAQPARPAYASAPPPPPGRGSFDSFDPFRPATERMPQQPATARPYPETGQVPHQAPPPNPWEREPAAAPDYGQPHPPPAPDPWQAPPRRPAFPDPYTQQPYQYPAAGY